MPPGDEAFGWSEQNTTWIAETLDPSIVVSMFPSNSTVIDTSEPPSNHIFPNQCAIDDFTADDHFNTNGDLNDVDPQLYTAFQDQEASPQTTCSFYTDNQVRADSTNTAPSSSSSLQPKANNQVVPVSPEQRRGRPRLYPQSSSDNSITSASTNNTSCSSSSQYGLPQLDPESNNQPPPSKPQQRLGRPCLYPQWSSDTSTTSANSSFILQNNAAVSQHHTSPLQQNSFHSQSATSASQPIDFDSHLSPSISQITTLNNSSGPQQNTYALQSIISDPQNTNTPTSQLSPPTAPPIPTRRPRGRPPLSSSTPPNLILREQNRLAAQRFRARHDAYMSSLTSEADSLEARNDILKKEVRELREQVIELKYGVLKHGEEECGCGIWEGFLRLSLGSGTGNGEGEEGADSSGKVSEGRAAGVG
jgi:hypothetical protein